MEPGGSQHPSPAALTEGETGFRLPMSGALCRVFAVLLCIGFLGGLVSFLIGVALPFGLMR
jgi:hypothetical protein